MGNCSNNINTSLKVTLKNFPKVEVHRHLEGTLDVEKLYEIAQKNELEMPKGIENFKNFYQFPKNTQPDFLTFIKKFRINFFQSLDDISSITYDSVKNLKEDGIFYIELRFAPHYFARQNNFDPIDVTKLIIKNAKKAAQEIDIHIRFLITFSRRTQTSDDILKIYDQITELDYPEIVGIDLAGDEFNFPPQLFIPAFDKIYNRNQHKITIHAGEVTSSEQVWSAIKHLHASRIGHGTSVIHDKKLQKYLKKHKIALEQCITSNCLTGSWKDKEETHPIGRLFRKHVPVTINSDDPSIQDSDLIDEYVKLMQYFNFSIDDLVDINKITLNSTFISEQEKESMKKEYLKRVKLFRENYKLYSIL